MKFTRVRELMRRPLHGRFGVRGSTVVLIVLFAGSLALWLLIRTEPTGTPHVTPVAVVPVPVTRTSTTIAAAGAGASSSIPTTAAR
jgi:hypothetical protein